MEKVKMTEISVANLRRGGGLAENVPVPRAKYTVECRGPDGELKWIEEFFNLVTNAGEDAVLDKTFKASSYTASWFVGLIDADSYTTGPAEGDTAGSHGGWAESTEYSNANRPTLTLGTVSSQSVDNSASKASFSINATTTIKGCFVIDNNTKGGTSGILYSAGLFSGGDRAVVNGDTLDVTVTLTAGGS